MIYDCFCFNNELELLKIRCEELKELDIIHVLVESHFTFTGNNKPLNYFNNMDLFKEYKIVHVVANKMPNNGNAWDNEKFQRNEIRIGLTKAKDDDIIIISDVDEIPRVNAIKSYNVDNNLTAMKMDTYRYYLNCLEGEQNWTMPRIMGYGYLKDKTPDIVRNSGYANTINDAGWHFSYLGGVDNVIKKIESFSHTELNTKEFKDKLDFKIKNCQSLFSDDYWSIVDIDESFPKIIKENKNIFPKLILIK